MDVRDKKILCPTCHVEVVPLELLAEIDRLRAELSLAETKLLWLDGMEKERDRYLEKCVSLEKELATERREKEEWIKLYNSEVEMNGRLLKDIITERKLVDTIRKSVLEVLSENHIDTSADEYTSPKLKELLNTLESKIDEK